MISIKVTRVIFLALFCLLLTVTAPAALAQDSSQSQRTSADKPREDETNFDTELYLVRASNQRTSEEQLPAALDQVLKQLRATLPFKNYSLAATLVNRVRNRGALNLTWVGGPLTASSTSLNNLPSFSEFSIGLIKAVDSDGGQLVQMRRFSFGARIPIQTGTNIAPSGTASAPAFVYERTGISTDITVRADQPAVVGTLNVGPSGDALVVVILARRVQK